MCLEHHAIVVGNVDMDTDRSYILVSYCRHLSHVDKRPNRIQVLKVPHALQRFHANVYRSVFDNTDIL